MLPVSPGHKDVDLSGRQVEFFAFFLLYMNGFLG